MTSPNCFEFQPQSQPFANLIQTVEPPFIVKYDSSHPLDEKSVTSSFTPNEPLLVHSTHKDLQLRARCVTFERENKVFIDGHCDAIIPDTYEGWFAVFGDPSQQTRELVVPHFRRVSQLAISPCTKFLIAGDQPVSVLQITKREKDDLTFCPAQLQPGTVLKKGQIFSIFSRVKIRKKFRKKEKVEEEKYLLASTSDGGNFFIPCDGEGLFHIIATTATSLPILKPEQIIQRYAFPVVVKLIHGKVCSSTPAAFNGTFVLMASEVIPTTLAVSILTQKKMHFEIQQDSFLLFHLSTATNSEAQEHKDRMLCYENQMDFCLQYIYFQGKVPDLPKINSLYMNATAANLGAIDFTKPMSPYKSLEQIRYKNIENLKLFPPSPISMKTTQDTKASKSVFTMNMKQIKRHVMYDRPRDRTSDIIPITPGKDSGAENSPMSQPRHDSGAPAVPPRPLSESEGSASSSASQPSLPDPSADFLDSADSIMSTPPSELLQDRNQEYDDSQEENITDTSSSYYRIWNLDSKKEESGLLVHADRDNNVTQGARRDETDGTMNNNNNNKDKSNNNNDNNYDTCDDNKTPEEDTEAQDDNGYIMVSDLQLQLRPPSYVSLSPLENENVYNTPYDESVRSRQSCENIGLNRSSHISSGSHSYITLEELDYSQNTPEYSSESVYANDLPYINESTYVNDAELTTCYTYGGSQSLGQRYLNISETGEVINDRKTPSPNLQKLPGQAVGLVLQEASSYGNPKKRLAFRQKNNSLKESSLDEDIGEAIAQYCRLSSEEEGHYLILEERDDVNEKRDNLIDKLKEQGGKRSTVEALMALHDSEFQSFVEAEEPIERLKELIPQVPVTDAFKIGICLRSIK